MSSEASGAFAVLDRAVQASFRAGFPLLRTAAIHRLVQALCLLVAARVSTAAGSAFAGSGLASSIGVWAPIGGGVGAALVVAGLSPAWMIASALPDTRSHRRTMAATAMARAGLVWGCALLPLALVALAFSVLETGRARVVASIGLLPLGLAGLLMAVVFAVRLGGAPLLAALRPSTPVRALREGWSLPVRPRALSRMLLIGLELVAAVVATTTVGWLSPEAVASSTWGGLIATELEAAALWRMLGAPLSVLAVFVEAFGLAAPPPAAA